MTLKSEQTEIDADISEGKTCNFYVKNDSDEWVMNPAYDAWAKSMYYSDRVAYDSRDSRMIIGRYNESGEVIKFNPWSQD